MQKLERKFAKFIDLKTIDDENGPGGFEGHASISGNLDDGGDIILDGSFKSVIDAFLRSGFTAHSHEWDIKDGVIGYPMEAYEDENGLFVSMKFHSTDDAQTVRTKMRERIEDGKEVGLSIGYRPSKPTYIYPKDFEKELPKYLKPEFLEAGLAKAKQFKFIRVIPTMSELKEFSVVTSPMNQESQVVNVKSSTEDEMIDEEKVGARNSGRDKATIQNIHDMAAEMEPSVCPGYTSRVSGHEDLATADLEAKEVKDIFSEEMARRSEPKPYQIWDAFCATLCRVKKLKRAGVDNVVNTSTVLDEAITAMTDQLRSAAQAELDQESSDSEMSMAFYGQAKPAEQKKDENLPPVDEPIKVNEEDPVKEELPAETVVEEEESSADKPVEELDNKAAHNHERYRFEKSKTKALRQRASLALVS